ncbi:unnamed protein product [Polarella glacialis]|uniref:LAGLIDADG endonuclease n=1 Tax=Polarella glacialis TaxID=89957 RepID=A0A813FDK6_POLGL|nr:unnamed protein product [Polarella glacialis]
MQPLQLISRRLLRHIEPYDARLLARSTLCTPFAEVRFMFLRGGCRHSIAECAPDAAINDGKQCKPSETPHCIRNVLWTPNNYLDQLHHKQRRLLALMRRLVWPVHDHMTAYGQQYKLPFRNPSAHCSVSQQDLEYAAGFFDGDGCVTGDSREQKFKLQISQTASNCEALVFFTRLFGGVSYRQGRGQGRGRPVVQWRMLGAAASKAASMMASHPSLKKGQLSLASTWPESKLLRMEASVKLRELKDLVPRPEDVLCTWNYLAGFFDAEGCISVPGISNTVHLSIGQKHNAVLLAIQAFLKQEMPEHSSKLRFHKSSGTKGVWNLHLDTHGFSISVLRIMMVSGLIVKKKSAELVLLLDASNHADVRTRLAEMSGNQSIDTWLDAQGVARARHIGKLQSNMSYYKSVGNTTKVVVLQRSIQDMKELHRVSTAETNVSNLRKTIREMIGMGCEACPLVAPFS